MLKNIPIMIILFSSLFFSMDILAQESPAPTGNENSIRDRIKEKVESARSNPKAYIGTVTDKTQDSIQIKDANGEILFVSVNTDEVNFTKSSSSTQLKFNDVAIGDYVIAMGYRNGTSTTSNSVTGGILKAKRIVVTSYERQQRKILVGSITKIANKDISIKDLSGQLYTYTFPKSWKGPEINELEAGESVAIVAVEYNGKYMVRTIQKIEQNMSE